MAVELKDEQRADPAGETNERVVLGSAPLPAQVPARVLIAPWGQVASANGTFLVDEEAGRAVLEAFRRHGTDVPVDYEHQSLGGAYASPTGQAPAAGWIRALQVHPPGEDGEPGLYADVEWTDTGRQRLVAREYRYLSPVVLVRKSDRRVMALHSVALTNKPAIVGMRPIVNREDPMTEEGQSDPESNGPQTPGEQRKEGTEVMETRVNGNEAGHTEPAGGEAFELLRMRLGLPTDSGVEAVLAAAGQRLDKLTAEAAQREARERVERAFRAGKLTGAQQEWAMSLAMRDPAGFDEWAACAPVVVSLGRTEPPEGPDETGGGRAAIIASARAAYRSEPLLELLTSEEAWIEDALREAGIKVESAEC